MYTFLYPPELLIECFKKYIEWFLVTNHKSACLSGLSLEVWYSIWTLPNCTRLSIQTDRQHTLPQLEALWVHRGPDCQAVALIEGVGVPAQLTGPVDPGPQRVSLLLHSESTPADTGEGAGAE